MSRKLCDLSRMQDADEHTLADLAEASGLEARTIRSWVARGLLPGPVSRGPGARYPSGALERLLAVRAMRDVSNMSLSAIRQALLSASPEVIRSHAQRAARLGPEPAQPKPEGDSAALDYLRALRARQGRPHELHLHQPIVRPASGRQAIGGFEALESKLGGEEAAPARKARAEEWLRLPVTPDVELAVRGRPDVEQRARLERCASLIRDILLGGKP